MFTGFLGRIVVKPGFSRRPSLPTPINAAVQNLHKEVHHPSIVGFSGERMRLRPSAPGHWSKHPALLKVLDYSSALVASNGSGKTTSTKRKRLVGMEYGGLVC